MAAKADKEKRFMDVLNQFDGVVRRVCFMYSQNSDDFNDLYQETMVRLWQGLDSFRGDAKISTWIYRATVNSCISWLRLNKRHSNHSDIEEALQTVAGDDTEHREQLRVLYGVIRRLDTFEKALIMMWLDSYSYDEIAEVAGISRQNVGTRLHRIRAKIKDMSETDL